VNAAREPAGEDVVLRCRGLGKTYRKPFTGARVVAVSGVSIEVARGEIFGFLGPNGAGKTTTIKMLTGLIAPTEGTMEVLGTLVPSHSVMAKVGFLPENPYVYPYLTPREFVSMCGRLSGLGGVRLRERVGAVLDRVGVGYAQDRAARTLSKGMLQRVGLAAALVHDPELLILDEPMSGLDPIGRKEVRDIIEGEKRRGRTVFFSTHILSDVETLCDRVCILKRGRVVVAGRLSDLLSRDRRRVELAIAGADESLRNKLAAMARSTRDIAGVFVVEIESDAAVQAAIEQVLAGGARLESLIPKRETLEDLFVREVF
jgi:ABC-2 type transport system ATP-binding protein